MKPRVSVAVRAAMMTWAQTRPPSPPSISGFTPLSSFKLASVETRMEGGWQESRIGHEGTCCLAGSKARGIGLRRGLGEPAPADLPLSGWALVVCIRRCEG